jgi:hypothetical protein
MSSDDIDLLVIQAIITKFNDARKRADSLILQTRLARDNNDRNYPAIELEAEYQNGRAKGLAQALDILKGRPS